MDEDVTKLTDEELDARIEGKEPEETEKGEAEESEDSTQSETKEQADEQGQSEEAESEHGDSQEDTQEAQQEEQQPPSRREQLRIQQILDKRARGIPPQSQQHSQSNQGIDYSQALEADPEVIRQLEADRQAYAEARYNEGAQQAQQQATASEFRMNIKMDYPLVKDKLDKLDPQDREALDKEYLDFTGYDVERHDFVANPSIGYKEYVEARIEQAERLASRMNSQTVKNVARQAANTGLRPDGSSAKRLNLNQPVESMNDEELEAYGNKLGLNPTK